MVIGQAVEASRADPKTLICPALSEADEIMLKLE
jgi:hypothetical protein